MNLSVTQRIVGGYGVVLLLALGILVTGLIALTRINAGLMEVVDETAPMLSSTGELQSSLLQAHATVSQQMQTTVITDLAANESAFAEQQQLNQAALDSLKKLTDSHDDLAALLAASQPPLEQFFALAPEVLQSRRQELTHAATVAGQLRKFGDMADEVESAALDAGRDARSLAETLSEVRASAERTLEKNNAMAVLAAERQLQSNFSELDALLARLPASQAAGLKSPYERFKTAIMGETGLMKSYYKQLNERKTATSKASELAALIKQTLSEVNALSAAVAALNNTVKVSAQDTFTSSRLLLLGFALSALLVATMIAFAVSRSICPPLLEIVATIRQLATGDLTASIALHRQDELGNVADSVRELIDKLRSMLTDILSNSEQLAAAAEQTSVIANTTLENISHQQQQTEMVASAATELAATVEDVAKSTHRTLTQVETTVSETTEGQRVIASNSQSVRYLAEEIERATAVISRVSQESDNIGAVLDVIRGVAEQTNLLALNAAIEAARAGEQGRGFAVVADEVRTLASRSQNSTAEIHDIIQRLQAGSKEAVDAMAASRNEASATVDNIVTANAALERITSAVDIIKDMSTQIASAAEEQNAVTQDLHRNVSAIAEAAEQNATGARENQAASRELARLAEQQKRLAGQFRL